MCDVQRALFTELDGRSAGLVTVEILSMTDEQGGASIRS
jgi:hypothetical protein